VNQVATCTCQAPAGKPFQTLKRHSPSQPVGGDQKICRPEELGPSPTGHCNLCDGAMVGESCGTPGCPVKSHVDCADAGGTSREAPGVAGVVDRKTSLDASVPNS